MTMCINYVYKRRKLRNCAALLPEKVNKNFCGSYISSADPNCHCTVTTNNEVCSLEINLFEPADEVSSTTSLIVNGNNPMSMLPTPSIPVVTSGKQLNDSGNLDSVLPGRLVGGARKASEVVDCNLISDHGSRATGDYSSRNSCMERPATSTRSEAGTVIECASSDGSVASLIAPPHDCSETSETCINSNRLVGDAPPIDIDRAPKSLDVDITGHCVACQICNLMGNSSNMLICDLCEKACHLHCCSEKIPLREDWYCQLCRGTRPHPLLHDTSATLFSVSGKCQRTLSRLQLGPTLFMLNDTEPYISKVRIGEKYQAEVPEWPVIPFQSDDSVGEPSKLDMKHLPVLRVGNITSYMLDSTGNWVQCRDKDGSGAICGKWRRAPLFVRQIDDWDCSCAVLWDPYHADCSVPQEMETEQVLKQLKYIEQSYLRHPKQRGLYKSYSRSWNISKSRHWELVVIAPKLMTLYYLDPMGKTTRSHKLKLPAMEGIKAFRDAGGQIPTKLKTLTLKNVKYPMQNNDWACGYYVMKYMQAIVKQASHDIQTISQENHTICSSPEIRIYPPPKVT